MHKKRWEMCFTLFLYCTYERLSFMRSGPIDLGNRVVLSEPRPNQHIPTLVVPDDAAVVKSNLPFETIIKTHVTLYRCFMPMI